MVGLAASIAIIATLTVVIVNHQSRPAVDTSHDLEIAKAAIMPPSALGDGWEPTTYSGELTSTFDRRGAATVDARCEPYLDAAFDTAGRQAVTAGQHFAIPGVSW